MKFVKRYVLVNFHHFWSPGTPFSSSWKYKNKWAFHNVRPHYTLYGNKSIPSYYCIHTISKKRTDLTNIATMNKLFVIKNYYQYQQFSVPRNVLIMSMILKVRPTNRQTTNQPKILFVFMLQMWKNSSIMNTTNGGQSIKEHLDKAYLIANYLMTLTRRSELVGFIICIPQAPIYRYM